MTSPFHKVLTLLPFWCLISTGYYIIELTYCPLTSCIQSLRFTRGATHTRLAWPLRVFMFFIAQPAR